MDDNFISLKEGISFGVRNGEPIEVHFKPNRMPPRETSRCPKGLVVRLDKFAQTEQTEESCEKKGKEEKIVMLKRGGDMMKDHEEVILHKRCLLLDGQEKVVQRTTKGASDKQRLASFMNRGIEGL